MPQIILAARGRITTHFREDIGRGFPHNGIDQGHGDGNAVDLEIRAPAAGTVTASGRLGSYGNRLVIRHADNWTSLLAHHAEQYVSAGDTVVQGQLIAEMGNTGTVFVHNHQELRDENGTQIDPLLHLGGSTASGSFNELEEIDMATAEEIAKALVPAIWTYMLIQKEGEQKPGRAADWLTNLPDQVGPNVWGEELTHPNGTHAPASKWLMNTSDMVGAILSKPSSVIDTVKLAAALKAGGLTVTIDQAALVKAIDASLSDNFAAIPGAVRNAIVK